MNRRKFLKTAAAASIAPLTANVGLAAAQEKPAEKPEKYDGLVEFYKTLHHKVEYDTDVTVRKRKEQVVVTVWVKNLKHFKKDKLDAMMEDYIRGIYKRYSDGMYKERELVINYEKADSGVWGEK